MGGTPTPTPPLPLPLAAPAPAPPGLRRPREPLRLGLAPVLVRGRRVAVDGHGVLVRGPRRAVEERLERRVRRVAEHLRRRHAEQVHDAAHLVRLVGAAEERLPRVHLHEDAAEGPYVDLRGVPESQEYLRGAVEPGLDVLVHALRGVAAGAEVDDLDRGALRVAEQDVLRLEVAVDHVHVAAAEEGEGPQQLPRELAD